MEFDQFMNKASLILNLDLNSYKSKRVQRRVEGLMRRYDIKDYTQCYNRLKEDPDFRGSFLDHFTINTSEFFRNPATFSLLKRQILPDLLKRNGKIKIWSAACSIGAEPYSIAIYLNELGIRKERYTITATDIDPRILAQARKGIFKKNNIKNVPEDILARYFEQDGEHYIIDRSIKHLVEFKRQNLLADQFEQNWDLIVCRNFMIYLSNKIKDELIARFVTALKKDGVLFLGNAEFIFQPKNFGLEKINSSYYRKI